ncbi:hypothetical protein AB0I77_28220 [Streptomyces sp. NPDC050619]|uniref:hypothetical protein n=1 Tax=Streptomyces sp. NPDC050619 TaxID=3157214 RepID=UPI003427CDB9
MSVPYAEGWGGASAGGSGAAQAAGNVEWFCSGGLQDWADGDDHPSPGGGAGVWCWSGPHGVSQAWPRGGAEGGPDGEPGVGPW